MSFVVDKELVALTGGLVNAIEGVNIGLSFTTTDGDPFAPGQANVVTPFFFHTGQDGFFVWSEIEHPFMTNVASIGSRAKPLLLEGREPYGIAIFDARLDFEHKGSAFVGLGPGKVEQNGQGW